MAEDLFRYDLMVETALRTVVRDALKLAGERGLPGNHHFYITFRTTAPGMNIPDYLVERYPDEMTIVLQFQFWDLEIEEDRFSVTLSFNDVREPLTIPFDALTGFADPSVQFGLQFQETAKGDGPQDDPVDPDDPDTPQDPDDGENQELSTGEVVSLDQFRKNK